MKVLLYHCASRTIRRCRMLEESWILRTVAKAGEEKNLFLAETQNGGDSGGEQGR